jgi:dihydroorotate dehydrogenase
MIRAKINTICDGIINISNYYTLENVKQDNNLSKNNLFVNNLSKNNLFVSPPFGNYQNILKSIYNIPENTVFIKGSYTLEPRPGLWCQVFKTLRYSFAAGGWVNKIGLRNPGINYAISNNYNKISLHERKNVITSIAILDSKEIPEFQKRIPNDMNLEINISCPNTENNMIAEGISGFLNPNRKWCIIKLSPITSFKEIDKFYQEGFRQFHCSNTLPVMNGGLSGSSLRPYTTRLVSYISKNYPDCKIIAGGGISSWNDMNEYKKIGATGFSMSTMFFNPWKCYKFFNF